MKKSEYFPKYQASTIIDTDQGLLVAWLEQTHKHKLDVCIYLSVCKEGKWTNPKLVADGFINDTESYPCWNPVLFRRNNGDIILFFKVGPNPLSWVGMYKISNDDGYSWAQAVKLPGNFLGPLRNKPIILTDNSILYPTGYFSDQKWVTYLEKSDQDLCHWEKIQINNNGFNSIQPSLLSYKNGNLQLLSRSRGKRILETWSKDQGETWSPMQMTNFSRNNSGIDTVSLSNGLQLLIYTTEKRGRSILKITSTTNGKNWEDLIVLENQPEGESQHPNIVQKIDGSIYITYIYNHTQIKHLNMDILGI